MAGNTKAWRLPVACAASVAMLASVGVSAMTANADDATVAPYNFTVTFDTNGHGTPISAISTDTNAALKDGVLTYSELYNSGFVGALPEGASDGDWTFTGWYTAPEYGAEKFEPGTFLNKDTTLYAHWAAPDDLVTINFNESPTVVTPSKTTGKTSVIVAKQDKKVASWELPTDTPGDRQALTGWTTDGDTTAVDVTAEDLTTDFTSKLAYATPGIQKMELDPVTKDAVSVNFKYDSTGSGWGAVDVPYGEKIALPDKEQSYNEAKQSYVTEWEDESGNTLSDAYTADEANNKNANDAYWTITGVKHAVAHKVNLFTEIDGADQQFDSVIVDQNTKGEYPAPPARNSGTFSMYTETAGAAGSAHSYDTVAFDSAVNKDTNLAAQWAVDSVTVTYDYNYAGKSTSKSYKAGDEFTLPTAERDGYVLMGWYTKQPKPAEFQYIAGELRNATGETPASLEAYQIPTGAKLRITTAGTLEYFKVDTAAGVDSNGQQTTSGSWIAIPDTMYAAWQLADNDQLNNVENKVVDLYDANGDYAKTSKYFTDESWAQYVKDYQAYVAHKTELGASDGQLSNAEAAELMTELQAAQAKLVQKASAKVYRMYNPYNHGDHLYTTDKDEYEKLMKLGWKGEGVKFNVTSENTSTKAGFGQAVYRVYNPFNGEHLLTTDASEVDDLVAAGWQADNDGAPAFYAPQGGNVQVTRLFNPYETVGTHLYTTNQDEIDSNVALGWVKDAVAFAAMK